MISINFTLVIQLLNLLVLIWIMNRLMYKPIQRIMAQRADSLAAGKAEAKAMVQKAEDRKAEYEAQLAAGRTQARERVHQLRAEAGIAGQSIVTEAQAKAKAHGEKIAALAADELAKAKEEVAKEAEKIARSMATAILGRGV